MSRRAAGPAEHAVLALTGRGELPFSTLHGTPLLVHALGSLVTIGCVDVVVVVEEHDVGRVTRLVTAAGLPARVLTGSRWWRELRAGRSVGLVVHDPLCPLASAAFLASVRETAAASHGISVAAYRPVTDTVKTVVEGAIHGTIDREGLAAVGSPVVIAREVMAAAVAADEAPPLEDFGVLAAWLRHRGPLALLKGPSLARRVEDESAVNLLECVVELDRQVRHDGLD